MPPVTTEIFKGREEDRMNTEPTMSGKTTVGLIIPPPDIRAIVEKTAQFVARNGIDFENKIKEKEAANPRFGFLSGIDPYFAFYRSRVAEYEKGVAIENAQLKPQLPDAVREHVQQAEAVPKNPPPAFEFMADPATINAFDLDLMRMTSMFVARNGRNFMTNLMQREHRNHQFDFLKPQHANFPYFTKLVEQYTKVIISPRSIVDDLARTLDYDLIVSDVKYRVAWEKHRRANKEREDKAVEAERLAYNSIDWHDFVVVQTVDFQPSETLNLPPLCTPREVGSRILMQQRSEAAKAAAESVAMEMESDSEDEESAPQTDSYGKDGGDHKEHQRAAYEVTQPTPAPPQADSALVRDYDPRKDRAQQQRKPAQEKFIISPLTNQRISADKLHDHVRYSTFDPKYKEQRTREQENIQDDAALMSSSGTEISRNIARLAERRTDIFGVGAAGGEQTEIGKKLGEMEEEGAPRPDARNIWDGQQSTIDATTRFAQQHAERIAATAASATTSAPPVAAPPQPTAPVHVQPPRHTSSGTLGGGLFAATPTGFMPPPHGYPMRPPMDPYAGLGMGPPLSMYDPSGFGDAGPASKRLRLEDQLLPEEEWLKRVNPTISVLITTPIAAEWNLAGQSFRLNVDIKLTIGALKSLIQETTTVPTSKQKLCYENMYPKDTNTLAFYNLNDGHTIQLQLKERGGKKNRI